MINGISFDGLESPDQAVRSEAILGIALLAEFTQLASSEKMRRIDDYRLLGLTDEQLLAIELDSIQLGSLASELTRAFHRWGDSTALWALGKMPIRIATNSILKLFREIGQLFDEEDLWQAGCVLEIGLGAKAISQGYWPIFKTFADRCRKAEDARLHKLLDILRYHPVAQERL